MGDLAKAIGRLDSDEYRALVAEADGAEIDALLEGVAVERELRPNKLFAKGTRGAKKLALAERLRTVTFGKGLHVTTESASAQANDLGGDSILQGESKEAVAELLKGHPHFMMGDGASIDVVEIMPIPGM